MKIDRRSKLYIV